MDTDIRYPTPVLEMMEAVHYIKQNCHTFNLDPDRLFLLGFSAGAHLCASYGVFWNSPHFTDRLSFHPQPEELKVSGMILAYPLINPCPNQTLILNDPENPEAELVKEFLFQTQTPSEQQKAMLNLTKHVDSLTLPAFIWHSIDDPIVCAADTTRFVLALQENKVDCEYHLFGRGRHGLGLATKTYARNTDEIQPDIAIWTKLAQNWMEKQSHSH